MSDRNKLGLDIEDAAVKEALNGGGLLPSHERLKSRRACKMDKRIVVAIYVVAMIAVVVGVDFAFLRNRFWERLIVNIGIVLVFGTFYFRFLMRP